MKMEMNVRRVEPTKTLIRALRRNKFASWFFAFSVGVLFAYFYGFSKNLLFYGLIDSFSLSGPISESQIYLLAVVLNSVVALTAGAVAALVCGAILVYVYSERALFFSMPAIVVNFMFKPRFWQFWKAPNLGFQISVLIEPILSSLVFVALVWLFLKKTPLGQASKF